jgi:D-serine deaminase-like pyridoxal phosphate-dependent protein
MTNRPPAEIGMALEEVDTPALLIDLDAFERNLQHLAAAVAGSSVRLRPHAKTHKCAVIARRQMALGAVGVCCQKVGEAEAMVYGGVPNVLVSNEVVGAAKLKRLAALARQAQIYVCADDVGNVGDLSEVAAAYKIELPVLVEVDVGANRCGVQPGEAALSLAQQIDQAPGLRFAGLQAYQGRAQHLRSFEERRQAIGQAVEQVQHTTNLLSQHGLECELVSGAGSGTYSFEAASQVYNELQAGSYIFMDVDYGKNLAADGAPWREFEHSLFVYATVMSRPNNEWAVVDAGLKALTVDSGLPQVADVPQAEYAGASDEHGKVLLHDPDSPVRIGDKLRLIPGHCDPTVNLYDWYVGLRNNRVEALWPIVARGAGH